MNRTDRLYALVEELRAASPRPRSARWLACRFEVCTRTVERDIGALQQSGVPIYAEPGRTGGDTLDKARTPPPGHATPPGAGPHPGAPRRVAGTPLHDAAPSAVHEAGPVLPEP